MRAVVFDRYGPPSVLRIGDVEQPIAAGDEVLVRVRATSATRTGCGLVVAPQLHDEAQLALVQQRVDGALDPL